MKNMIITLANRKYHIGCEDGQEPALMEAVELLNTEMRQLGNTASGIHENQHLMLGGIMLASRMLDLVRNQGEVSDQIRELQAEVIKARNFATNLEKQLSELQEKNKSLKADHDKAIARLGQVSHGVTEIEAMKAEIEELRAHGSGVSEEIHEQALTELSAMRTEIARMMTESAHKSPGDSEEVQTLRAEVETLKAALEAAKGEDNPRSSPEDSIALALNEIVSSLESLNK